MSNKSKISTIVRKNGIYAKKIRKCPIKEWDEKEVKRYFFQTR